MLGRIHSWPQLEHGRDNRRREVRDEGVDRGYHQRAHLPGEGEVEGIPRAGGRLRELDDMAVLGARGVFAVVWRGDIAGQCLLFDIWLQLGGLGGKGVS